MVVVKLEAVKLVVVLVISIADAKFVLVELCHLVILPVLPLRLKVVEFVPEQTVADPAIVPPTLAGLTVPDTDIDCDIVPDESEIVPE